eukprot:UN01706
MHSSCLSTKLSSKNALKTLKWLRLIFYILYVFQVL